VKENRRAKIKQKIRLNFKNSTAHNHPKGMGTTGHFPNVTSPGGIEVLDVMLRNRTT